MNNITGQLFQTGLPTRQHSQSDLYAATYVREQSFGTRQNLDTHLVLNTRDGDQVTLSANTFSQAEGYLYDARGIVQNENGSAALSISQREITLESGQSFSFTVQGNLSEDELNDIESLLKGLDSVIAEMTKGNMEGAMDEALELGGYDSVSSFAADIHYQRSYEMSTAAAATAMQTDTGIDENSDPDSSFPPGSNLTAESWKIPGKSFGNLSHFEKFFDKLFKQFDNQDAGQQINVKDPLSKLLQHHLDNLEKDKDNPVKELLSHIIDKFDMLAGPEKVNNPEPQAAEKD